MPRGLAKTAYWICVAVLAAAAAGCAETTYPSLPTLPSVGDSLLTPTEQQKAIKDLSQDQKNQGASANKETEGR